MKDWLDLATERIKEKKIQDLNWQTPEGIEVKTFIHREDLKNLKP